ncbi:DNA-binding response regulator [Corticibacter populi]|uniref:DNA-binding response regulator n=1 Tax=Corticibacter populi TaxID=1550736 RepID=A0A3M6QUI9_9BURK|nr:response regulator [Corticibacter populi]RMX06690.1 DNA-binding response regulator [Corticibacter populi]RZS31730.1 response regulator receiver domain-containing protein [Corticibacter populi]
MTDKLQTFIVEDNHTIRENLTAMLEELTPVEAQGFAVSQHEALDWLHSNQDGWRLLIVDLFLQSGTGLGVIEAVGPIQPDQHIVILSNYVEDDIRQRSAQLGVSAVFDKSRDIEKLIDFCNELAST